MPHTAITYLDNSATTPVCREAADKALYMMTDCFGNPSSLHSLGYEAELEIASARKTIASLLGTKPACITFTSGGTEGNNLAILGGAAAKQRAGRHIVTTAVEHASVAQACSELERQGYAVTRITPDKDGMITAAMVADACRPDTVLVSVMMVNNETGARFPIEQMVPAVRRAAPAALFHCDAVQSFGKLPIHLTRLEADMLTISAHKIHGPKGCGALYVRQGVRLLPRVFGGSQERGLRPGTEAAPLIAAFGAAAAVNPPPQALDAHYRALDERLRQGLAALDGVVLHLPAQRVPYILNLSLPGIRSETMLHFLSQRGIFVSSGSACSKGARSPVLTAMGIPDREIDSALRISFSRQNTAEDVDRLLAGLQAAAASLART